MRFRRFRDGTANRCELCGQHGGTALPRRASRNMVGSGERKTDQCHECSAHGARRTRQPRRGHVRDRPRRRAAQRARSRWRRPRRRTARSPPWPRPSALARSAILAANAEDVAEAKSGGATAAFLDRLTLDADRDRGGGGRTRGHSQAQGSGRHGHGVMAASQRHAHRACACAARRRRRDLREPAQRDGRCRRALPQGRQRRDPARRLRKFPHRARHPCGAGRRPGGRRNCQRPRLRSCRRGSALPSA